MKIGDLAILHEHHPTVVEKYRHHLGVIVDEEFRVGSAGESYKAVRVAWTNGERRWYNTRMLKPYKGYAGKKHNDIK